jgi:hypothetical protein
VARPHHVYKITDIIIGPRDLSTFQSEATLPFAMDMIPAVTNEKSSVGKLLMFLIQCHCGL